MIVVKTLGLSFLLRIFLFSEIFSVVNVLMREIMYSSNLIFGNFAKLHIAREITNKFGCKVENQADLSVPS